jgi:hypothetical protein
VSLGSRAAGTRGRAKCSVDLGTYWLVVTPFRCLAPGVFGGHAGGHNCHEGDGRLARTMRFATPDELEAGREELETVIRAWCDWKAG